MNACCPRCSNQVAGWVVRDLDGLTYCISCGHILNDPGMKLDDGLLRSLMQMQNSRWEMVWERARARRALVH